jgi:hypothetical protein
MDTREPDSLGADSLDLEIAATERKQHGNRFSNRAIPVVPAVVLFRQLGVNEDEPIENPMVTRRVRTAQQRIEERATANHPAQYAQEWLERNCPCM